MNSRNGVRVNGALVTAARLAPGDVIEIGGFRMTCHPTNQQVSTETPEWEDQAPTEFEACRSKLFGDIALLAEIRSGDHSRIYRAKVETSGEIVCVKSTIRGQDSGRTFLQREFEVLSQTGNCPLFVGLLGKAMVGEAPALVLNWMGGGSLADRLRVRSPGPRAVPYYLVPVLEAIRELHEFGWVHNDIKPSNVLFDAQREAKLSDFGTSVRSGHTATELVGSHAYMAPERWESEVCDPRSDVFAAACLVYEVLVGVKAFPLRTVEACRKAMRDGSFDDTSLRQQYPAIADMVARGLAADMTRRPTIAEMIEVVGAEPE